MRLSKEGSQCRKWRGLTGWEPSSSSVAAQEKVPTPKEQELAKERLSSCERPTSATLASPFLMSTLGDLMSCGKQGQYMQRPPLDTS